MRECNSDPICFVPIPILPSNNNPKRKGTLQKICCSLLEKRHDEKYSNSQTRPRSSQNRTWDHNVLCEPHLGIARQAGFTQFFGGQGIPRHGGVRKIHQQPDTTQVGAINPKKNITNPGTKILLCHFKSLIHHRRSQNRIWHHNVLCKPHLGIVRQVGNV